MRVRGGGQDGVAKGACGAHVVVLKAPDAAGVMRGGSVGKGFGYGAQRGLLMVQGEADARAGIRLSGADMLIGGEPAWPVRSRASAAAAQVKGFAFEYMTAGRAVVLGDVGPWAFAGMTGGVVYVRHEPELGLDEAAIRRRFARAARVALRPLDAGGEHDVAELLGAYERELAHVRSAGGGAARRTAGPRRPLVLPRGGAGGAAGRPGRIHGMSAAGTPVAPARAIRTRCDTGGPMSRTLTAYTCSACGFESPRWLGRCTACGEWNTLVEEVRERAAQGQCPPSAAARRRRSRWPMSSRTPPGRISTGSDEFDRVLGGGLVSGSLVLVGGEPGVGKSSLLLQALARDRRRRPQRRCSCRARSRRRRCGMRAERHRRRRPHLDPGRDRARHGLRGDRASCARTSA